MEGLNLHKPIRPFYSKEKNKETLAEQSAFVNNFLATIDGVRVEFVDNLDGKPFSFFNIESFKDNQIYIENGETKERKVET